MKPASSVSMTSIASRIGSVSITGTLLATRQQSERQGIRLRRLVTQSRSDRRRRRGIGPTVAEQAELSQPKTRASSSSDASKDLPWRQANEGAASRSVVGCATALVCCTRTSDGLAGRTKNRKAD
jgi:hypothetical protein